MASLIVVEDLVGPAVIGRGGHAIHVLQFLEGLRRLGHDVLFVEFLDCPPDERQQAYWTRIWQRWWTADERAALLDADSGERYAGVTRDAVARHAEASAAVIQLAASYRATAWPIIGDVRPRIVIDTDPGYTHLWAATGSDPTEIWGPQDVYFTVGLNVGTPRTTIPTVGRKWDPIPPWVVPDWWPPARRPTRDRFTTVAAWRDYGYLEFEGRMLGPKVEQFEAFLELPAMVGEPLELTLAIDRDDPDLPRLRRHGWIVVAPSEVDSADRYRDYVAGSLGEFSVAKGGYVGTSSGWFSDRSACYLAAGRPVIVQNTAFDHVLPVGRGLFAVDAVEEAARAIRTIRADYARHSAAARKIAEQHFDAERVAHRVLTGSGVVDAVEASVLTHAAS